MRVTPLLCLVVAVSGCKQEIPISDKLDRPPAVTIMSPEDGFVVSEMEAVDFVGKVLDQDGLEDLVKLEWSSDIAGVLATLDDAPPDSDGITQFAATLPPGTHAIQFTAVDGSDLQATTSISVTVEMADYLPVAEISVPTAFARYEPGEDIQLVGAASDPNQPPEELTATWEHAPEDGGARTTITTIAPTSAGSVIGLWEDAPIGIHRIFLTIQDTEGNTDEAEVSIEVIDPNADDQDLDGFPVSTDCNDADAEMAPGLPEICDNKDNDCNGIVDDKDLDSDDHIDRHCVDYVDAVLPIDDCDDTNGTVFPGAAEQADNLDNDCDGVIDDGLSVFDNDGDCFCTALTCTGSINPYCATLASGDCNDENADLHARDDDSDGATPCDGDCDDLDPAQNLDDLDGDGWNTCENDCDDNNGDWSPADIDSDGTSACDGDCNDLDAQLNVLDADSDGASTCAGDCNDGSNLLNLLDTDGDTFTTCAGDCDDNNLLMTPEDGDADGHSSCEGDCDDTSTLLNARDDDGDDYSTCDNDCDDTNSAMSPADDDGDTYSTCTGDCNDLVATLNPSDSDSDGTSSCDGDCNDASAALNVNDSDSDNFSTCEGDCNDLLASLSPADLDGDGYSTCTDDCNDASATLNPADVDGDTWSTCDGDCNDVTAGIYPTATEIAYNGVDDDCAGGDLVDVDGDGYSSTAVGGTDCRDTNASVNPSATETCSTGYDDNCDGKINEQNATGCSSYYYDGDNDGYGRGSSRCQCGPNNSTGYDVTNNTDCYDSNADARPGQTSYFYDDRGDGSWDYNCDNLQTKIDNRTSTYECETWLVIFPPAYGCDFDTGWETSAPSCGETENWGLGCFYFPGPVGSFCEPNTLDPVDQECR